MNFGDQWECFMGSCNAKQTEEILDYYYEHGGKFLDTANNYQSEESETRIGDWIEKRGNGKEMGKTPCLEFILTCLIDSL